MPGKLVDHERQMTRLPGRKPSKAIKIAFNGLRPGEKLQEELFCASEPLLPTEAAAIRPAAPRTIDYAMLSRSLDELAEHAGERRQERMLALLVIPVPEYAGAAPTALRLARAEPTRRSGATAGELVDC